MAHVTANAPHGHAAHNEAGLFRRMALAVAAARQRRHLADLDDTLLRDIGLSREAAEAEARRSVWDVPASWLR